MPCIWLLWVTMSQPLIRYPDYLDDMRRTERGVFLFVNPDILELGTSRGWNYGI